MVLTELFYHLPRSTMEDWVIEARARTMDLVHDLSDAQLQVPLLNIINPLLWEIGHVAYFQEYWVLRRGAGHAPIRADSDSLYDSGTIPHDTRWDLLLPSRSETLDYLKATRDRVLDRIAGRHFDTSDAYFVLLSVFHEDMHDEAITWTRQTLGYPAPAFTVKKTHHRDCGGGALDGDAAIPAGTYSIGSKPEDGFIFDNEKWGHAVDLSEFRIARAPVTQSEFARFVDDGGYQRTKFWSPEGLAWREQVQARHPVYWRLDADRGWLRRHFDRWIPVESDHPVVNVCWYEAEAYCRWARRRLPSEFEWEIAARTSGKSHANLDWSANGPCNTGSHSEDDSVQGCRQMIGNVWEWTASTFLPYPGFCEDPYKDYSKPWFGEKSLRGGSWCTRSRMIRPNYRNFFLPERRDLWAGFRTCALES